MSWQLNSEAELRTPMANMLSWFAWGKDRSTAAADSQLQAARQQLLEEQDVEKLRYRAMKLLEERQADVDRARAAELEVRKTRHEMEKLEDDNVSLLKRLEVVEDALARAKESRVAMELAEAKVALANMELLHIELKHVAHREHVAREAAEKQLEAANQKLYGVPQVA